MSNPNSPISVSLDIKETVTEFTWTRGGWLQPKQHELLPEKKFVIVIFWRRSHLKSISTYHNYSFLCLLNKKIQIYFITVIYTQFITWKTIWDHLQKDFFTFIRNFKFKVTAQLTIKKTTKTNIFKWPYMYFKTILIKWQSILLLHKRNN